MGDGSDLDLQSFVVPKSLPRLLLQVVLLSACTHSLRLLEVDIICNKQAISGSPNVFFWFGKGIKKKTLKVTTSIVDVK